GAQRRFRYVGDPQHLVRRAVVGGYQCFHIGPPFLRAGYPVGVRVNGTRADSALSTLDLFRLTGARGARGQRSRRGLLVVKSDALQRADVGRLRTLLALGHLELDPLVLFQTTEATGHNRGKVREDVRSAAVRGDEPKTLVRVEPLDSADSHDLLLIRLVLQAPEHTKERPCLNPTGAWCGLWEPKLQTR